jgi:hypothetical protein
MENICFKFLEALLMKYSRIVFIILNSFSKIFFIKRISIMFSAEMKRNKTLNQLCIFYEYYLIVIVTQLIYNKAYIFIKNIYINHIIINTFL